MKKMILMTAMLVASVSVMAGTGLRNGEYIGQTRDGRQCGVSISPNQYVNGYTRIDFTWRKNGSGYEAGYVLVKDTEVVIRGDIFAAKSNNDIAVAKVKLTLANDGSPIEAKMGLGLFVQFGYDETCLELVKK